MKKYFLIFVVMVLILGLTYSLGEKIVMTLAGSSSLLPVTRVNLDESKVSFTYNLTSNHPNLKDVLEVLSSHNVKATFFISEEVIYNNAEILDKLKDNGHHIGLFIPFTNNTQPQSVEELTNNIQQVSIFLESNLNISLQVVRPYPTYSDNFILACKTLQIKPILWDVDSNDEKNISAYDIIQRVTMTWDKGSIIMFNNTGKYTAQAMEELLNYFKLNDVEVIPLSELLHQENYYINNLGEQIRKR